MEWVPGVSPKHWRFLRDGEELPRFTLGETTEGAAIHVLEALNAYERPGLHPVGECAEVHPDGGWAAGVEA